MKFIDLPSGWQVTMDNLFAFKPMSYRIPQYRDRMHRVRTTKLKKIIVRLLASAVLLLQLSPSLALEVPPLRGRVNDYAGMLPRERNQELARRLAAFEKETSHQLVVLTVPSLDGDPLEDFSIRVAEAWKIGQQGYANGAILIIAQKERKIRIEVGRGFEGILPDATASRIVREIIAPRFRAGDFAGGIEAAVDTMIKITRGEQLPPPPARQQRAKSYNFESIIGSVFMVGLFALIVGISQRNLPRGGFGGAATAGVLGQVGFTANAPNFWLWAIPFGALLGAIGGYFAGQSKSQPWLAGRGARRRDHWGGDSWGPTLGGGGFSGGGFSSGDSSDSFSGGGGDFAGGGASGEW
jgi:uncharacterized protein